MKEASMSPMPDEDVPAVNSIKLTLATDESDPANVGTIMR
jgi:tRNA G18 (ribose-2'-O)-methylase SpoU